MSRSKHAQAQMIAALKQVEAGRKVQDGAGGRCQQAQAVWVEGEVWRHGRHASAEATQLRDENNRLRKLVADLSLDKEALQSVIRKNVWSAACLQASG